ncbi:MAG: hypothetical protein BAJALOKI2v1_710016 [Promethearchaeota archaeon]|nr:MAG: hypothetical protein BAJALOKI2v1_710016 [Candidatus Lokiarchaeota archaeon]
MTEELREKLNIVKEKFESFSNFIELPSFRDFLLFTLNSQVASNILAQFGLGGNKEVINIPYNPLFKIYYQKINLISAGALIVYVKNDPITEKYIIKKDDPILKEYLNPNEMDLAFRAKEKFIIPKVSDCTSFNQEEGDSEEDEELSIKIDDLYHDMKSFLTVTEPNILFVLDAENDSEPDMIFAFNMSPELPGKANKKILKADIYLDYEHKTKGITYLKKEENFELKYLEDIKEISHADLYKSSFSLILHIKSFKKVY